MCFDLIDFWVGVIVLTCLFFGLVCLALPDNSKPDDAEALGDDAEHWRQR